MAEQGHGVSAVEIPVLATAAIAQPAADAGDDVQRKLGVGIDQRGDMAPFQTGRSDGVQRPVVSGRPHIRFMF